MHIDATGPRLIVEKYDRVGQLEDAERELSEKEKEKEVGLTRVCEWHLHE